MHILSLQSQVTFGCVGHNASVFPLQRLGMTVWALPSVLYSNHGGYDSFQGEAVSSRLIGDHLKGLKDLNKLSELSAFLSGYLGRLETAQLAKDQIEHCKSQNPAFLYFCDPVMGDAENGLYIDQDLAHFIRDHLICNADFLAPNLFELKFLSGRAQNSLEDCLLACDLLRARGPKNILVSSFIHSTGTKPTLSNLIVSDGGAWKVTTPYLPLRAKGTGDCLSALFLAHILRGETAPVALELATASLFGVISETVRHDSEELRLIEAQAEFLNPSFYFDAERIG